MTGKYHTSAVTSPCLLKKRKLIRSARIRKRKPPETIATSHTDFANSHPAQGLFKTRRNKRKRMYDRGKRNGGKERAKKRRCSCRIQRKRSAVMRLREQTNRDRQRDKMARTPRDKRNRVRVKVRARIRVRVDDLYRIF